MRRVKKVPKHDPWSDKDIDGLIFWIGMFVLGVGWMLFGWWACSHPGYCAQ